MAGCKGRGHGHEQGQNQGQGQATAPGGRLPTVLMRPPPQLSVKTRGGGGGGGGLGGGRIQGPGPAAPQGPRLSVTGAGGGAEWPPGLLRLTPPPDTHTSENFSLWKK